MNVLLNNLRGTTCVINNLLKNNSVCVARGFKSDLKIKWIKPKKVSSILPEKSGDGGVKVDVTDKTLLNKYEQSRELQDADEIVKKMFTLEFQPYRATVEQTRQSTMDLVKGHQLDAKSIEVALAKKTAMILHLQEYMESHPRNRRVKHHLKEMIDSRRKLLGKLRRRDYKKFEWLLEKLNLTFKPVVPVEEARIERKKSLRKLTVIHCDKIRQDRLDQYKAELDAEKKIFFKEKLDQLEFIRSEEISCGVEPTITEEDIATAREQAAQFQ